MSPFDIWFLVLICASVPSALCTVPDPLDSGETRLYAYLADVLDTYEILERPVKNHSETVQIDMQLELQQIVDIDEKNQVMEMNVWIKYHWYDYRLTWQPDDYEGVTDVRFPPELIWRPDILLINSADREFGRTHMANILVFHDGLIEWVPPGITKSSCILSVTWFPFDDQYCHLKFGSWSYSTNKLVVTTNGTVIKEYEYIVNGEWILMDYPSEVKEVITRGVTQQHVYFYFHLRRRTLYFGFNLIIPSLLVATLSILGFTLPVESGEKITLEITILLSICLFMNTVTNVTPITSESIPLLILFFFCHMIAITVSIAFNMIVLNFYYRAPKTHSMSEWTRTILLNWLPWILRMQRPQHTLDPPSFLVRDISIPESLRSDHSESDCQFRFPDQYKVFWDNASPRSEFNGAVPRACLNVEKRLDESFHKFTSRDPAESGKQAILLSLQQLRHELKFISEFADREEEIDNVTSDWQFASMVVDRMCLVFFSIFTLCASIGVLFSSPHLVA